MHILVPDAKIMHTKLSFLIQKFEKEKQILSVKFLQFF